MYPPPRLGVEGGKKFSVDFLTARLLYETTILGFVSGGVQKGSVVYVYEPVTVLVVSWTTLLPAAGTTGLVAGHPGIVQLVMVTACGRVLVKVSELTPGAALPPLQTGIDIFLLLEWIFASRASVQNEATVGALLSN